MKKKLITLAVGAAVTAAFNVAHAVPFNSFDPRTMAMGGAGVGVANTATSPFFNPAMLSVTEAGDNFAMELPIVGLRAYDPEDFTESVDSFQDDPTIFDAAGSFLLDQHIAEANAAIRTNPTAASDELRVVATDTRNLSSGFTSLSDKMIEGEAGAGMVIGIPNDHFGAALFTRAWGMLTGVVQYRDADTLSSLASDIDAYADCLDSPTPICSAGSSFVDSNGEITFSTNDLTSKVNIRGVLFSEVGVSLSSKMANGLALGLTPKLVRADILDYQETAESADQNGFNADEHIEQHTGVNVDLGLAKDFGNGWRTGFVVKNLIPQEFDTTRKDEVDYLGPVQLKPQARVGISRQTGWTTLALDVDLTENEPIGFEEASRHVSLGAELNAADWAQLRVGYRVNTINSDRNIASVGLGLSPFGVHFDLGLAGNQDEIGAALQFGARF